MKKITLLFSMLLIFLGLNAQTSLVKNVSFTNIGPSIMSGRVVDVDVNPQKPSEFYVAYASGGLWYTNNNGTTFTPISENAPTQNMGDIAIDWKNGTIWVGTGESNSSRSSYSGIGILKSTNKGKTWENVGLKNSQHIGRIIINKNNPNEVVVGVIGNLYTTNKERGIYKTIDGGITWKNVLFIDENTGVIDISVSPNNSNVLYAASWERIRKAWNFDGDGKHSAIYKSTDAGSTWEKITTEKNGFPTGSGIGRIGLAAFNDEVIYALLDNQFMRPEKEKKKEQGLKKNDFKKMSKEDFLRLDNKELNTYLRVHNFDRKYSAENVKTSIRKGKIKPSDLAIYLEDANFVLLNSEVIGAEVYKSDDGGKTWNKTHKGYLDGMYSSYGYYFGIIAVNSSNQNKIYIGGVPLLRSDDGGENFSSIGKENVHSDHQALWVNPNLEGHIIDGNDGGINITYDDGENWIKNNSPAVGQFYYINVDSQKPYNVFGGLQDNGVWYGPSNYEASKRWESSGNYPYKSIGGGDGMQVQIDNRDNNIVYSGSQFGYYFRYNLKTKERMSIHPTHELGDTPYRYNWQTPILLSPHNQDILYMGANKLLRSMDQGATFDVISDDLTTGGKKGNVPYGTLTSISESPFQFGFIYVGSDDGYVNITENGGATWKRISDNLPQGLWVSRVIASQHENDRVYVTLNGYRNDDFKPYVYVSEDKGVTWKNIGSQLPNYPINVIKEDPADENILYLGTDNEAYVSFDKGENWQLFSKGLPKVAIHDLVIQKEAKDLVIGTHGRSIYKANIAALQKFNSINNKEISIIEVPAVRFSSRWGSSWSQWYDVYEPKVTISYYVASSGKYTIDILAENGIKLKSYKVEADKGFNYFNYNVSVDKQSVKKHFEKQDIAVKEAQNGSYYLPKGKYIVKISNSKGTSEKALIIN
ncbi:glycosyl hydrolase [uncultured Lutibacter sp.]|uniref:VPS10 domain-containing protein n=1 Tax=uncultured Lutibacter sp. TaxID=437739 RepID=UPI0026096734|nr:glycosyl hydrolase [uncultured Lutibacter sp.]